VAPPIFSIIKGSRSQALLLLRWVEMRTPGTLPARTKHRPFLPRKEFENSIRRTRRHRRLPMAVWNPRQIATKNIDSERGSHEDSAYPEAPVPMHSSPVRTGIGLPLVAAISFQVMLASSQLVFLSWDYYPGAQWSNKIQMHNAHGATSLGGICE